MVIVALQRNFRKRVILLSLKSSAKLDIQTIHIHFHLSVVKLFGIAISAQKHTNHPFLLVGVAGFLPAENRQDMVIKFIVHPVTLLVDH